jgi:hypothetical protein
MTPGVSSEMAYNVCPSSDLSSLTGRLIISTNDSLTPSSAPPIWEPDRVSEGGSENFPTASQGSSDYLTAKSPSLRGSAVSPKGSITSFESFESLPSIPSESEYQTADTGYSRYRPFSEPSLDSEYITTELCPTIPSEHTPTRSSIKLSLRMVDEAFLVPYYPPNYPPNYLRSQLVDHRRFTRFILLDDPRCRQNIRHQSPLRLPLYHRCHSLCHLLLLRPQHCRRRKSHQVF